MTSYKSLLLVLSAMARSFLDKLVFAATAKVTFIVLKAMRAFGFVKSAENYRYQDVCDALAKGESSTPEPQARPEPDLRDVDKMVEEGTTNQQHRYTTNWNRETIDFTTDAKRHDVGVEEGSNLQEVDFYYLKDGINLKLRTLDRGTVRDRFTIDYVVRCLYCDTWHPKWKSNCHRCGAPLPNYKVAAIEPKPEPPKIPPKPFFSQPIKGAGRGQMTIQMEDGNVQIEPFTLPDQEEAMCQFDVTLNNFCVCRGNGYIVDIILVDGTEGKIKLYVNGRDTGVSWLCAAMHHTVNSRMPSRLGISSGASIQFRWVKD
jgi:hypothetical protein